MSGSEDVKILDDNCTEMYKGIIVLRKGQIEEKEMWFATVGKMLVSDGVFETKELLKENLENVTLDRICKMCIGIFDRIIEITKEKKESCK